MTDDVERLAQTLFSLLQRRSEDASEHGRVIQVGSLTRSEPKRTKSKIHRLEIGGNPEDDIRALADFSEELIVDLAARRGGELSLEEDRVVKANAGNLTARQVLQEMYRHGFFASKSKR